jgi:hypothetical protein
VNSPQALLTAIIEIVIDHCTRMSEHIDILS